MLILRAFVLSFLVFCAGFASAEELVNINSAKAGVLAETMTGIGLKRAEDIVTFREDNGPFKSVDDLVLVKGIGASTVDKNRERIKVE
jgi:competence protein ComEA